MSYDAFQSTVAQLGDSVALEGAEYFPVVDPELRSLPLHQRSSRPLTPSQAEVLLLIVKSVAMNGWPPTLREIGVTRGTTRYAIEGHVIALERKGFVHRTGKSRALALCGPLCNVCIQKEGTNR